MNYDVLNRLITDTRCVNLKHLEEVLGTLYYEQSFGDDYEPFEKVTSLKMQIEQDIIIEGSKNDYHNVAVTCARGDDYRFACLIIEEGLKKFPNNIDLLADYLAYGLQGGTAERCEIVFEKLMTLKERWNWRGYSFVIDYLQDVDDLGSVKYSSSQIKSLVNDLTLEYIDKMPDKEESYCSRFDYIKDTATGADKIAQEQKILLMAVNNATLKRVPKSLLRLADLYYDCGNVKEADIIIERCKSDSLEVQTSVNRTYVYLLSTLCKLSIFYELSKDMPKKLVENDEGSEREKYLRNAYEDFHVASLDFNDTRVKNLKSVIKTVVRETGIAYPYDDGIEE